MLISFWVLQLFQFFLQTLIHIQSTLKWLYQNVSMNRRGKIGSTCNSCLSPGYVWTLWLAFDSHLLRSTALIPFFDCFDTCLWLACYLPWFIWYLSLIGLILFLECLMPSSIESSIRFDTHHDFNLNPIEIQWKRILEKIVTRIGQKWKIQLLLTIQRVCFLGLILKFIVD